MGFFFGSATKPKANKPPKPVSSLRVQSSVEGKPLPILWGRNRVGGNLIWYGAFRAVAHKTASGGGGGKGGGKKKKQYTITYTYEAAVALALGHGPLKSIVKVWKNKTAQSLESMNFTAFLGASSQLPWGYLDAYKEKIPERGQVPLEAPYTYTVEFPGTNYIDGGVMNGAGINMKKITSGSPNEDEYLLNTTTGTYTFSAADAGELITITYNSDGVPTQGLNYNGVAYVAAGPLDLGDNPELPNLNFEYISEVTGAFPGSDDANAADVILDFLLNPDYSVNFPAANVTNLDNFRTYTRAAGLVVSPMLVDASDANSFIGDLVRACNSECVWSGGKLDIVTYADSEVIGNGVSFVPNIAPVYDLTDNDFLIDDPLDPEPPIKFHRGRAAEQMNLVQVEILDRANDYNTRLLKAPDDALIAEYGPRPADTITAHFFCTVAAGQQAAQLRLGREALRNTYMFKIGQRFIRLDPMDTLTLTESTLGLDRVLVRVQEITEDEEGRLDIVAEDCLLGSGNAPLYAQQNGSGFVNNDNSPPPPTNEPIIIAAPIELSQNLELWLILSGSEGWGGATIWLSSSGDTYREQESVWGPARQGVLTATFGAGSDPDTTNTLKVDLTESLGELLSGTTSDANQANTLCYVDGEFIAYETATLTAGYQYDLGTYIRRGLYNSPITAHAAGSQFARLDNGMVKIPYTVDQIGTTMYLKVLAFNVYGGGEQELGDVTPISFVVPAPYPPPNVSNFGVSQKGNVVVFTWDSIVSGAIRGYDIGYAPLGTTSWDEFRLLTEVAAGTEMTNAAVPPGEWTFGIRAVDIAGQLSPQVSLYDLTVLNSDTVLLDKPEDPAWTGTLYNFFRHWTGILIPYSTNLASTYGYDLFDEMVPDPVSFAHYTAATYDGQIDGNLRIYDEHQAVMGWSDSGSPDDVFQIDTWLTGDPDPDIFIDWTVGFINFRYLRPRIRLQSIVAGSVPYLTHFTPFVDSEPRTQQASNVVIAAGGTVVYFDEPFREFPFVFATVVAATGLFATANNITLTSAEIDVWNISGTSVGGTVNVTALGA